MRAYISVNEALPNDFYCMLETGGMTKDVVAIYEDEDGKMKADNDWMETDGERWYWGNSDDVFPYECWMPLPDIQEPFYAELKERFPELYKSMMEGGAE